MTGLEDPLHPGQNRQTEGGKFGAPMVDHLAVGRAQNAVRNGRWAWDLQKMPPSRVTLRHSITPKIKPNRKPNRGQRGANPGPPALHGHNMSSA
jgi:hypothetical protein